MAAAPRPRRSALYIPGSNARALDKGRTIPADVLILDLEDAVSADQKEYARAAVADALPGLAIVLDHVGTPESQGVWAGREAEARADWAARIRELALRPNVLVKLGGLGMDIGAQVGTNTELSSSEELAERWRPYIETCIEAFTPARAMFESNFPPDNAAGSYGATWNAFKRIAASFSEQEKDRLFRRTAAETYRIALD